MRELGVRWCTVIDAALLAQPSVRVRLAELGVGARGALRDLGGAGQALTGVIDPLVVRALTAIAAAPVPFTGVDPLALHLGTDADELGRAWRRDVIRRGGPQLNRTVRAALLFRLLEHDPGSGPMSAVRVSVYYAVCSHWGTCPGRCRP